jgi:predicted metal-dependent peptidase|tara:strand:- start:4984 stop:6324 length:1341 start_codon:yes stop_codon:yes gene_type:complete
MNDARKHLSKGFMSLIRHSPFFTSIIMQQEIVEDENLPAIMAVDGKRLYYHPAIVDFHVREIAEILKHEAMHITNKHHIRMKRLKKKYAKEIEDLQIDFKKTFNIAADLSINGLIIEDGFVSKCWRDSELLSSGCIPGWDEPFENFPTKQSLEFYFKALLFLAEDAEDQPQDDEANCKSYNETAKEEVRDAMQGQDNKMPKSTVLEAKESEEDLAENYDREISKAIMLSKQAGEESAIINQLLKEAGYESKPKINWRAELRRFFSQVTKGKPNYKKPNRRFDNNEIILPTNKVKSINEIVLLLDVSGSMSDECVNLVYKEIEEIICAEPSIKIRLIPFDHKPFTEYEKIFTKSNLPIKEEDRQRVGCGGTQFCNALAYAESLKPQGIIMLTDMMPCDRIDFENYSAGLPIIFVNTFVYSYPETYMNQYCTIPKWCTSLLIEKEEDG